MFNDQNGGQQEEELLPLFTLSPQQSGGRSRNTGAAHEEQRAVFQRHHTFGYDCRLDEDYRPGTSYDDDSSPKFKPRDERKRKLIFSGIVLAFLLAAGGLVATQPATRDAVTGMGSHFFGGSSSAPTNPQPSATADVLALGTDPNQTPAADPTASADPAGDPTAIGGDSTGTAPAPTAVPAAPAPTAVPAAAPPTADPATAPPIYVNGTYTTNAAGTAATTCQAGKMTPGTCTWQVTIQKGYPIYTTVSWQGEGSVTLKITDASGAVLTSNSGSTGNVTANVQTPPATVFVVCTVTAGTNVNYTLGLAAHTF